LDYVIVPTDNLQNVQKMEIDEGKQWTPYRILKEKNETRGNNGRGKLDCRISRKARKREKDA